MTNEPRSPSSGSGTNRPLQPFVYTQCRDHGLPFEIRPVLGVKNRADAKAWIIRHQLTQLNLTPLAVGYYRGIQQQAENRRGGRRTRATSGKNRRNPASADGAIGHEGLNDAELAEDIDVLVANGGAKVRDYLFSAECRLTRREIHELRKLSDTQLETAFDHLLRGDSYEAAVAASLKPTRSA